MRVLVDAIDGSTPSRAAGDTPESMAPCASP
jgi:hypothetical protein